VNKKKLNKGLDKGQCECVCVMAKNSSRHTPRAYALARREAHAPRRGEGACVTTLLEMPFGAQR